MVRKLLFLIKLIERNINMKATLYIVYGDETEKLTAEITDIRVGTYLLPNSLMEKITLVTFNPVQKYLQVAR